MCTTCSLILNVEPTSRKHTYLHSCPSSTIMSHRFWNLFDAALLVLQILARLVNIKQGMCLFLDLFADIWYSLHCCCHRCKLDMLYFCQLCSSFVGLVADVQGKQSLDQQPPSRDIVWVDLRFVAPVIYAGVKSSGNEKFMVVQVASILFFQASCYMLRRPMQTHVGISNS